MTINARRVFLRSIAFDTENLASSPKFADTLRTLRAQLSKGWRGALPR